MPSGFRFLLICMGATQRLDDQLVSLHGIVNELTMPDTNRIELAAVVGVILRPDVQDKSLDLMAWRLGTNGELQAIPGYAGTPLILPAGIGPQVLPYDITLHSQSKLEPGIYGFHLFDRNGAFGTPESLLATYMFSVKIA